jgi:hypothetical protein
MEEWENRATPGALVVLLALLFPLVGSWSFLLTSSTAANHLFFYWPLQGQTLPQKWGLFVLVDFAF